jgi:Cu+-exporting ATPase
MEESQTTNEQTYTDPVCGMTVTASDAAGSYEYKGTTYYFCAPGCMNSFRKDPEKYLGPDYKPSM